MHFPKNIYFYWDNSKPIPNRFLENIKTFQFNYTDFNVELINDDKINSIAELNTIFPELLPLYNKLTIYAAKSDIARLIYLYFYGGIYLDTHIEHIFKKYGNNIYKLFDKYKKFDFVIARNSEKVFNCSSIISKPRCKLLYQALHQIINNLKNHYELEINTNLYVNYDILQLTGSANFYTILEFDKIDDTMSNKDIINNEPFKKYNSAVFCCTHYLNYYKVYYEYNHNNYNHWSEQQKTKRLFIKYPSFL
jgi:mannosyltransferase OCH1-like enzyme